jgi:hypothetical protein
MLPPTPTEENDMSWFEAAGINVSDVQEDPYAFGEDYWPLYVKECRAPKVSDTGKFGMYVIMEIAHDKYDSVRPFGRWIQLPTPLDVQKKFNAPFDPKVDLKDAKVVAFLMKWLQALGFKADEIQAPGMVNETTIQGKLFLAKLKVVENDQGYDDIIWRNPKQIPDAGTPEGMAVFSSQTATASPVDALTAALAEEKAAEEKKKPSKKEAEEAALKAEIDGE